MAVELRYEKSDNPSAFLGYYFVQFVDVKVYKGFDSAVYQRRAKM